MFTSTFLGAENDSALDICRYEEAEEGRGDGIETDDELGYGQGGVEGAGRSSSDSEEEEEGEIGEYNEKGDPAVDDNSFVIKVRIHGVFARKGGEG